MPIYSSPQSPPLANAVSPGAESVAHFLELEALAALNLTVQGQMVYRNASALVALDPPTIATGEEWRLEFDYATGIPKWKLKSKVLLDPASSGLIGSDATEYLSVTFDPAAYSRLEVEYAVQMMNTATAIIDLELVQGTFAVGYTYQVAPSPSASVGNESRICTLSGYTNAQTARGHITMNKDAGGTVWNFSASAQNGAAVGWSSVGHIPLQADSSSPLIFAAWNAGFMRTGSEFKMVGYV